MSTISNLNKTNGSKFNDSFFTKSTGQISVDRHIANVIAIQDQERHFPRQNKDAISISFYDKDNPKMDAIRSFSETSDLTLFAYQISNRFPALKMVEDLEFDFAYECSSVHFKHECNDDSPMSQDVISKILSFSDLRDIPNFSTVCSFWNQIIMKSNTIWIEQCLSIERSPNRYVQSRHRELLCCPQKHRTLLSVIKQENKDKETPIDHMDNEQRLCRFMQKECSARKALRMGTLRKSKIDSRERMILLLDTESLSECDIKTHFEQFGDIEKVEFLTGSVDPVQEYAYIVFRERDDTIKVAKDLFPVIKGQQCKLRPILSMGAVESPKNNRKYTIMLHVLFLMLLIHTFLSNYW